MLSKKSPMNRLITAIKSLKDRYKFARYLFVGATNTLLCMTVMYLGAVMGLGYLTYTAMGYLIGIISSFFMNLHFTFRVEGQIAKRLILFFAINFTNLLIVELIEYVLIDYLLMKHLPAILSGMLWYMSTGYLMNNFLVYREKIGQKI